MRGPFQAMARSPRAGRRRAALRSPTPPARPGGRVDAAPAIPDTTAGTGGGSGYVPAGMTLTAWVRFVASSTQEWSIAGGTITPPMPADTISYQVTASAGGTVVLGCTETN